ncbi:MAG TPA: YbhB/YbcL family Raf kinase inhibitor-like protein [Magnetospirillaceae bacterium]|jgi:hypothetical protein
MRRFTIAAVAALGLFGSGVANAADFSVSSGEIKSHHKISDEQVAGIFGCKGGDVSPSLTWKDAPANTKSFAIMIYDPDAPTGSGFWHWVAFNIPATTTSIAKGASGKSMPAGTIESRTDFGVPGYHGPCPPPGPAHHYHVRVFAVDIPAIEGADANTSAAVIGFNLHFHTLAKAEIVGMYGVKK